MLNKPILTIKIPYASSESETTESFNYAVKVLNSSFSQSIDDLMPIGSVLQSTKSEDVFKAQVGQNWSIVGSTVVGGITINIFQKIN
jgi:hypothetical protein